MEKHYEAEIIEKKWKEYWEKEKIYKFDPKSKKKIYSIDTPPPTVSGDMHIGHAFSYSQQDFLVRFWRQFGLNVFFPFGTDDNGLPTERLVERLKKVRSVEMSRAEFVKLCNKTIKEIKPTFIQDWKDIGMSCDWETTYSTIDEHCIKTSQKSFLDLYKKKLVYRKDEPTIWCVNCQTAIAQAELEDSELDSSFVDVQFELEDGEKIIIATTRPELLPGCVCIFVHPDDKRYKKLVGKKAKVPLFKQLVPIFADKSADPEKGSGILMICSYGDRFDVDAIDRFKLEPRVCFTKDGKLNGLCGDFEGMKIREARKNIINELEKNGLILNKRSIRHTVNVHDKCGTEIEFIPTKQWFIEIMKNKKKFLDAGNKIKWYPASMKTRYVHWIEGLKWDWCISRQRHFGVSFPLWYCQNCGEITVADENQLPLDPLKDKPSKKCKCGSDKFIPETDVMDTWQTSSVTPQIVLDWVKDKKSDLSIQNLPMGLRPQAHDIIRTWAFYTIVKSIYHENKIPWENVAISGHIQDSKGRKMSKSLGNVISPREVLKKYGADVFRFMSAGSKLGEDFPFQEKDLITGKKMINKLWNASKFVFMQLEDYNFKKPKKIEDADVWILSRLNYLIEKYEASFKNYDYAKAKSEIEVFFWHTFCDNYLELVKDRLYNPDKRGKESKESSQYALYYSLLTVLKLFAPIMPFITEEIYHSYFSDKEKCKSIHISEWPKLDKSLIDSDIEKAGDEIIEILSKVRKFKTSEKKSMKEPVILTLPDEKEYQGFLDDLKAVTHAKEIKFGKTFKVEM